MGTCSGPNTSRGLHDSKKTPLLGPMILPPIHLKPHTASRSLSHLEASPPLRAQSGPSETLPGHKGVKSVQKDPESPNPAKNALNLIEGDTIYFLEIQSGGSLPFLPTHPSLVTLTPFLPPYPPFLTVPPPCPPLSPYPPFLPGRGH